MTEPGSRREQSYRSGLLRRVKPRPGVRCSRAVKLSHVVKVDMNINQEKPKTTNDLLDRMEQQLGARGRELLTKFIESLDKLERDEQASDNAQ